MEKVTAKITQGDFAGKAMTIEVDFDAILKRTTQDILRSAIKAKKGPAEVTKQVNAEWVPGTKRVGKPKSEKMLEDFLKLTDEERDKFLKEANQ